MNDQQEQIDNICQLVDEMEETLRVMSYQRARLSFIMLLMVCLMVGILLGMLWWGVLR